MNIGVWNLTGLFTDPAGPCNGMRPLSEKLFGASNPNVHFHAWDEASADKVCRTILAEILAGPVVVSNNPLKTLARRAGRWMRKSLNIAAPQKYDRVIFIGHSFGGALLKFLLDWIDRWHRDLMPLIDLAIFFDPAPNGPGFGQWCAWQAADGHDGCRWSLAPAARRAICFYQHNEAMLGMGICGVPFSEASAKVEGIQLLNVDASKWGVDHCSIITNSNVQAIILNAIEEISGIVPAA